MDASCTVASELATRPDGVCDGSRRTCHRASSPSPEGGTPMYNQRTSRNAKFDGELALRDWRNTSRRVICDKSVAETTISPLVSDHKACRPNCQAPEESA